MKYKGQRIDFSEASYMPSWEVSLPNGMDYIHLLNSVLVQLHTCRVGLGPCHIAFRSDHDATVADQKPRIRRTGYMSSSGRVSIKLKSKLTSNFSYGGALAA
jgi:hypothetical protein